MTFSESILRNADDLSCGSSNFSGALIAQEGAGGELITDGDYYREYNALHQLTKIRKKTSTGKIIEEYSYGPDGERIMTVNYLTNTTIYTPFREWMMIVNRTGTYNYTYVYDGNTLISRINPDGTKWFYHDDHLGSTSLITDENGNIVEETFYNPFGQVTSGGEREAYLLYTNQMKDAIGCYDYGARVYCPKWYHFTSGDPITANVFDPQGLNRFAYVKNNPYVYVDPTGKSAKKSGAASGYSKSGSAAASKAAYQAAHGGTSGSSIYLVYSEQGTDGPTLITISTEGGFDELQEALKDYWESKQNVYGGYVTTGVPAEENMFIFTLPEHEELQSFDPSNDPYFNDPFLQDLVIGAAGFASPFFAGYLQFSLEYAELNTIKAEKGEVQSRDYLKSTANVGVTMYGGKILKEVGLFVNGIKSEVSIWVDVAAEFWATQINNQATSETSQSNEGDENAI